MRVHELAKALGMTNAEMMSLCDVMGVGVKSHSSTMIEAQADRLRRRAERDGLTRPEQPEEPTAVKKSAKKAAAAPAQGLPPVQAFTLPIDELQQVAAASGLQWVNSDADKIAAVQAAIAAEPKPIRVPRERPPAVVLDEGPLVLVETRRDLSAMALPFEQPPAA